MKTSNKKQIIKSTVVSSGRSADKPEGKKNGLAGKQAKKPEGKHSGSTVDLVNEQEKKLYTVIIFSENTVGLLNQIAIIFTRRQLNIETLSVSPSAIEGIHKFTITTFADKVTIEKVVKQLDKRVDILKAYYNTDEGLVYQEIALYKLSTTLFIKMDGVEDLIRKYNARVLDINEAYIVLEKSGRYEETQSLFRELSDRIGVLQFIRSGRIAITKSKVERLSDMLASMENKVGEKK